MGFLDDVGETLVYEESLPFANLIKKKGILQLIRILKKFGNYKLKGDVQWGYEIESHVVSVRNGKVKCFGDFIRDVTQCHELNKKVKLVHITHEFGSWMTEYIPTKPMLMTDSPTQVLAELAAQRKELSDLIAERDLHLLTSPVFFKLGTGNYYETLASPHKPRKEDVDTKSYNIYSDSKFFDDILISTHPRFPTMARNIRHRRGEKVCIKVPIYQDSNTSKVATDEEPFPGYIYMDCQGFGMGNCCFQLTFSTFDIDHARHVYDMLAIISPFDLVLSAGSPFYKGKISDTDVRWTAIEGSVDDRNTDERNPQSLKYIPKSRYASISYYISQSPLMKDEYNDLEFPVNHEIMAFLSDQAKKEGIDIDQRLLTHFGFLYIRDPLIVFADKVHYDGPDYTGDFENIQSTNWNSVRFKPPPLNAKFGWRVELRTPEIALTPAENNAMISFSVMFYQMISDPKLKMNFYIPITKLDENFKRACKRNSIHTEKFYVRKNVLQQQPNFKDSLQTDEDVVIEVSMKEFFYGNTEYQGFLNLYETYIDSQVKETPEKKEQLLQMKKEHLKSIEILLKRATGELMTPASWMRDMALKHPHYKNDSLLSEPMMDDILTELMNVSEGRSHPKTLLG